MRAILTRLFRKSKHLFIGAFAMLITCSAPCLIVQDYGLRKPTQCGVGYSKQHSSLMNSRRKSSQMANTSRMTSSGLPIKSKAPTPSPLLPMPTVHSICPMAHTSLVIRMKGALFLNTMGLALCPMAKPSHQA